MSKRLTTEGFIDKAKKVHGDKYDYSKVEYVNNYTEVTIICPKHGEFKQKPSNHLSGRGCSSCRIDTLSARLSSNSSEFCAKARAVHGDKYDYSLVEYVRNNVKVKIKCREHGVFEQTPSGHLTGKGCPACGRRRTAESQSQSKMQKLYRCTKVHSGNYYYGGVDWSLPANKKVRILCPKHGEFTQTLSAHYSGQGCPKCSIEKIGDRSRNTWEEFVEKAREVHGDFYLYEPQEFKGNKSKLKFTCPIHGVFYQRINDHLGGHGCPSCARITRGRSEANDSLMEFIKTLCPDLQQERRIDRSKSGRRWRSDGYLPSLKLHIEFNGLIWHSTKFRKEAMFHLERQKLAQSNGEELIYIHEDEWMHKPDVVKHFLRHKLGKSSRVYARKCKLVEVETSNARQFYDKYHIQGAHSVSSYNLGLELDGELVACMSFSQKTSNRKATYQQGLWELVRFSSKKAVTGGATKLFKHFLSIKQPSRVVSFSMNHLFDGKVYEILGFKLDAVLRPDYTYVETRGTRRLHKCNFQHSRIKGRFKVYNSELSERENCENNGFFRIYDCGKKRWIWSLDDE